MNMVGVLHGACILVEWAFMVALCVCTFKEKDKIFEGKFWIIAISTIIIAEAISLLISIMQGKQSIGGVILIIIASIVLIIGNCSFKHN